jgi:hypothetical protein
MADDKTVILRVALDEGKTEDRMKELVLLMEQTRKAQQALTAERKAGTVSDEDFAKRTVELRNQLKGQQQESTALAKNLELYQRAVNGVTGSYDQAQAQLSLAQRQYQQLAGSAENSTEATQALSGVIDGLRNTLKATDAQQSRFVRNVGNYPKGENLEALVQQLVKLEEQSKTLTAGTKEANEVEERRIGFQQAAVQAGAKEGKTYEETTSFIKGYSNALRPAVAELVKLEQEQQQVAETAGEASEGVRKIGFQIAALEKNIKEVPAETKKLSTGLKEVAGQNSLVAGATEKYSAAKEKYAQVTNLVKLAIGGEVTALGLLRLAIIATGLGALVVVLGSVVVFLTKTAEGTKLVENVMAQVGAVVDVVIDRMGRLGKAVTQVLSGDFSGAADTAKGAFKGIGDEIEREVKLAGDLSKAQQQLDRDTANNIDTNKRLLNEVERLKNVRDNEFNTLQVRKKANEDAYQVELTREKTLSDLARRRIAILKAQIDMRGGESKVSLEQLKEYKEAQNELSDIQEDAAGKQNELITNRYQLTKDGLDKEKEATAKALDKRIALRKDALALEAQLIERQLLTVKAGSDEELSLQLNVKNLTVKQKEAIDLKYESGSLALTLDFNRRRVQASLQALADQTSAELAAQQLGSDESLRLQQQQIDNQRRLALAGLKETDDNTAKTAAINAQAEQQLNEYLDQKRQAVELDYAKGLIKEGEYQRQLAAINKAGTDAQTVINTDYRQSNTENQKKAAEGEIETARRTAAETKRTEEVKQEIKEATLQSAVNYTDTLITLFGEESAAGQAALALKKVLGLAEIAMNLQKVISANAVTAAQISAFIPPPAGPILGTAYKIAADALAISEAAAGAASILKLKRGGIAYGPSHENGGIPLTQNGRPVGIEIEGGEPVLTAGVSRSPYLLQLASVVNQMAGGRPLVPSPYMQMGGISTPAVRDYLGGTSEPIDYERMGEATAKALRKNPPINRWSDFTDAKGRAEYTEAQASS